jgi:hypothetical protein
MEVTASASVSLVLGKDTKMTPEMLAEAGKPTRSLLNEGDSAPSEKVPVHDQTVLEGDSSVMDRQQAMKSGLITQINTQMDQDLPTETALAPPMVPGKPKIDREPTPATSKLLSAPERPAPGGREARVLPPTQIVRVADRDLDRSPLYDLAQEDAAAIKRVSLAKVAAVAALVALVLGVGAVMLLGGGKKGDPGPAAIVHTDTAPQDATKTKPPPEDPKKEEATPTEEDDKKAEDKKEEAVAAGGQTPPDKTGDEKVGGASESTAAKEAKTETKAGTPTGSKSNKRTERKATREGKRLIVKGEKALSDKGYPGSKEWGSRLTGLHRVAEAKNGAEKKTAALAFLKAANSAKRYQAPAPKKTRPDKGLSRSAKKRKLRNMSARDKMKLINQCPRASSCSAQAQQAFVNWTTTQSPKSLAALDQCAIKCL